MDDILTVSKMDSSLLSITPVLMTPFDVAKEALQMFDAELSAFDIARQCTVEPSYHEHGADLVYCDPARLSQVVLGVLCDEVITDRGSDMCELTDQCNKVYENCRQA